MAVKEPLAVNTVEITEARFREGAKAILNRKYNRLTAKVAVVLLAVLAVLYLIVCLTDGNPAILGGEVILYAAVLIWLRVVLPRTEEKKSYRALSQNGLPRRETFFYEDRLVVRPGAGEETEILYSDIVSQRETAHLLILTCASGSEVLLDKEGFSTGSPAEVCHLIWKACA
ncbi:MAG: YcxB family protein [Clostridiales bacterium]|nr:YcxB family protein [Clostridiales bacterium]